MIKTYKKSEVLQLSENFNLSEFHCHCKYLDCTVTYLDDDLITYLQHKRTILGRPFHVDCGFRCTRHNNDLPGAKAGSQHLLGKAADIVVAGMTVDEMAANFADAHGLGRYPKRGFIHVDVRNYMARWVG